MTQAALDETTRQRLAAEVDRLVAMDIDRRTARRIVWNDYQDELAASQTTAPAPLADTPVPEPPTLEPEPAPVASSRQRFFTADPPFFTPERLARNRAALEQIKKLVRRM